MSEDQNTQPVADETNVPATPVAEVESARQDGDDLDTLLKSFDAEQAPPPPKPEPTVATGVDPSAVAEVLSARDEIRQDRFKKDMSATVADVRGDLPTDYFDDKFVQAWIDAQAVDDPRLSKAWIERANNPQQFKKVVGALGKQFAKKYGQLPDRQATEDRAVVTAAVRGASTPASEGKAPDFGRLSDFDFQKEKEKLFGT